jgi:hypothetical protein
MKRKSFAKLALSKQTIHNLKGGIIVIDELAVGQTRPKDTVAYTNDGGCPNSGPSLCPIETCGGPSYCEVCPVTTPVGG